MYATAASFDGGHAWERRTRGWIGVPRRRRDAQRGRLGEKRRGRTRWGKPTGRSYACDGQQYEGNPASF